MGGKIGDCKQRTLTVGMTGIQFDRYDSITVLPRYMGLSTTTYYLSYMLPSQTGDQPCCSDTSSYKVSMRSLVCVWGCVNEPTAMCVRKRKR